MTATGAELNDLLLGCYRQETAAQQRLYRNWYGFAHAKAGPYGQDTAEVEEIVQDAFLKVLLALTRDPFVGNFASYFHRIIVNAGIDYYRRAHRRRRHETLLADQPPVAEDSCNTALVQLEREDCIQFLQRLPPTYRIVFTLYVFEGYSHPEIADRLGISEGTSRSYLFKARRALRPLVGPYLHPNHLQNE